MRIGWVGLGEIGAPMAARVLAAGHDLTVWNRTPARMVPLAELGAATADSAAEVAERCEVLVTCIDTAAGLTEVLLGPSGVTAAARAPRLVVDTSTMPPELTRSLAERLTPTALVDAPVSGGPRGAAAGSLAVFVGGAPDDVALARPVLATFAGQVTHLGPLGSGQVGKLCNQVLNFATMAAVAEASALGASYGLDETALLGAVSGGLADSAMLREYARAHAAGEDTSITGIVDRVQGLCRGAPPTPGGGRVDILLKDLDAALDVARAGDCATPVASALAGLYRVLWAQDRAVSGTTAPSAPAVGSDAPPP